MRRIFPLVAAALFLVSPACKTAPESITVARPDLGFTASFPAQPIEKKEAHETAVGPFESTTLSLDTDGGAFLIMANTVPAAMSLMPPKDAVAANLEGQLGNLGVAPIELTPASLGGVAGFGARGAGSVDGRPVTVEARAAVAHGQLVFATALWRDEEAAAAAGRFFEGIRLQDTDQPLHHALWKELAPGAGRFRIELPGSPESSENPPSAEGHIFATHSLKLPAAQFEIAEASRGSGAPLEDAVARAEQFGRSSLQAFQTRDVEEKDVESQGLRGKEFRGRYGDAGAERYVVSRWLGGPQGMFILKVISRAPLDPTVYERFFGSLRVPPAGT